MSSTGRHKRLAELRERLIEREEREYAEDLGLVWYDLGRAQRDDGFDFEHPMEREVEEFLFGPLCPPPEPFRSPLWSVARATQRGVR